MTRFLVCPTDHFRIDYEINPWMHRANVVDPARAREQWAGLADLVFTANAGVVSRTTAVPSRFRHPERQREQTHFEAWFREHGFELKFLAEGCASPATRCASGGTSCCRRGVRSPNRRFERRATRRYPCRWTNS